MSTIKISELATSEISLTDFFAKANSSGIASKSTIQNLLPFFETIGEVGFKGSLFIADTPTLDGWYIAAENGTYTNAGGVVVTLLNTLNVIIVSSTQTAFQLTPIPLTVSVNGVIESGNLGAVSGDVVYENQFKDYLFEKIFINSNIIDFTIETNNELLASKSTAQTFAPCQFGVEATEFEFEMMFNDIWILLTYQDNTNFKGINIGGALNMDLYEFNPAPINPVANSTTGGLAVVGDIINVKIILQISLLKEVATLHFLYIQMLV